MLGSAGAALTMVLGTTGLLLLQVANYCVTKLAELNVPLCTHEVAAVLLSDFFVCAAAVLLQVANYFVTKLAELNVPLCTHKVAAVLLSHLLALLLCCCRLPTTV
jgi:hypothetical protein